MCSVGRLALAAFGPLTCPNRICKSTLVSTSDAGPVRPCELSVGPPAQGDSGPTPKTLNSEPCMTRRPIPPAETIGTGSLYAGRSHSAAGQPAGVPRRRPKPPASLSLGPGHGPGRLSNRDSLSINDHWPLPPTPHWHCGIACRAERDRETFKL